SQFCRLVYLMSISVAWIFLNGSSSGSSLLGERLTALIKSARSSLSAPCIICCSLSASTAVASHPDDRLDAIPVEPPPSDEYCIGTKHFFRISFRVSSIAASVGELPNVLDIGSIFGLFPSPPV